MMAELAATQQTAAQFRSIDAGRVEWLEQQTDQVTSKIELPKEFVVAGDSLSGAHLDLARTVVRRAERIVVHLVHDGLVENIQLVRYLNRLSSLLFVLSLHENAQAGIGRSTLAKA
jgi:cob(I)alamin adenosyltransferase